MTIRSIDITKRLGQFLTLILVTGAFVLLPHVTSAQANNKFGIHLAVTSDEDIQKAAELVNSNGGDYGYITLVIQENNRDVGYWQGIFEKLREKHLIPIIRLATQPEGENWRAPNPEDASAWAEFLNKLHWVVKDRYIILFNEPNHGTEWGGAADPVRYGQIAADFAYALKHKSPDFRIMLAGFDLAAPQSPPNYYDAYQYLQEASKSFCDTLQSRDQKCVEYIDLISSHAYPNPGFRGTPYDTGRTSIRGYTFELSWYRQLFGRDYPVMITETGWDAFKVGQSTAAEYFRTAFQDIWLPDSRVVAVTPFVLNYQGDPFLSFSFLTSGDARPYQKYAVVQSLSKIPGTPNIIDEAQIQIDFPKSFVEKSTFTIPISIKNQGQRIWGSGEYSLALYQLSDPTVDVQLMTMTLEETRPFETWKGTIKVKTGEATVNDGTVSLALVRGDVKVAEIAPQSLHLDSQPSLTVNTELYAKGLSTASDFELQVFDHDEQLVYTQEKFKITLGRGYIEHLPNIIPGKKYRVVILKPYYLPRQQIMTMLVAGNIVKFEKMLPLDFNRDGKLSAADAIGLFKSEGKNDMSMMEKVKLFFPN